MDWMNMGDRAAREGGQPRSGSEALSMLSPSVSRFAATAAASAQNASDSPSPTGCGGGRHVG